VGMAQPVQRLTRLPVIGANIVSTQDSTALVVNPAGLGLLPGAERRWATIYLDEQAQVPWQGHAIGFVFRLPIIPVGTGLRLDFIDPPRAAQTLLGDDGNYQWFTWGIGLGTSNTG